MKHLIGSHLTGAGHGPRPGPVSDVLLDAGVLEQIVLRAFGVTAASLHSPLRGTARLAFARQVAIYLLHVRLGLSLTRSARLFERDRTTAAHACRVVEDRRDEPAVDRVISVAEAAFERWAASRSIAGLCFGGEVRS